MSREPAELLVVDGAERALLGALLIAPEWLPDAREVVRDEDFAVEAHRLIWQTVCAMADGGTEPDLVLVHASLTVNGTLERAGGASYLSSIVDVVPCVDHVVGYAQAVHEAAVVRRTMPAGRR